MERSRVAPGPLLTECADCHRPSTSAASLEIGVEVPGGLPEVWGDRHRLLQVLANLVDNAFDPFWQARAGDRRGIGLGLSIARDVIAAHEGRIWAESEPGCGTTLFFSIPAAAPVAPDRPPRDDHG